MNFKRSSIEKKRPEPEQSPKVTLPELSVPLWMKLLVVLLIVIIGAGGISIYVFGSTVYNFLQAAKQDPVAAVLDFAGTEPLKDEQGRTNVLLLGSGGKEYDEGSDLTDSVMVVSIDYEKKHLTLISIPRDLVVKIPDYPNYHRINELFTVGRKHLGESGKDQLVRKAIKEALCLDVQYYAKIDFSGFKEIIDALGGIEVTVERPFTDYQYPAANYAYQTIHFDAGPVHMDGETALQFARSRHGTNGEASDFARAARQQKIIQALIEKARSLDLANNPDQIQSIIETVNTHYETDIKIKELLSLAAIAKKMITPVLLPDSAAVSATDSALNTPPVSTTPAESISDHISSIVFNDGPGGLLYTPADDVRMKYYNGAFVLLPDGDNFDTMCAYVHRRLRNPGVVDEGPAVEVLNGSGKPLIARDVGALLVKNGFQVQRRDNTFQKRIYEKTFLYDHSRGGNIGALMEIQKLLGGEVVAENTEPVFFSNIGITIVLGKDFIMPEGALGDPTFESDRPSAISAPTNAAEPTPAP